MKNEKELSPFLQKMKDAYLSRKENPEIIRPEDMRDEEYLRYTIRKKWREEKKRSRGWKTLKMKRKNKIRSLNPRQNRVNINNSDTLDGKNPTLKVFDY